MGLGARITNKAAEHVSKSFSHAVGRKVEDRIINKAVTIQDKLEEEKERANSTCDFTDGISLEEFTKISLNACKYTKRVYKARVEGAVVYAQMKSNTGKTRYHFNIDFNDHGHITGRYWLRQYNKESSIPEEVAEKISREIKNQIGGDYSISKVPIDPEVEFVENIERMGAIALMGFDMIYNSPKKKEKRLIREKKAQIRQEKIRRYKRRARICKIIVAIFIILSLIIMTYS